MTPHVTSSESESALATGDARRLVRMNVVVGLAHLAQAVLIVLLATPASLPVELSYLTGAPGSGDYGGPASLFDLRIDLAVAAFLLLAAVDHLAVASPRARRWYLGSVASGINPARWWEYSISASLMVVLIAMLAGITEATALLALFGVNAAMILFGLTMEYANLGREQVTWRPFVYGCVAGAVPWLAIALQIGVSQDNTSKRPRLRHRDLRHAVPAVQRIRGQHVAAIPRPRTLGGPGTRRARLPDPEPRRQDRARLACSKASSPFPRTGRNPAVPPRRVADRLRHCVWRQWVSRTNTSSTSAAASQTSISAKPAR